MRKVIKNDNDLDTIVVKLNALRDKDIHTDEITQEILLLEKQIEYYKEKKVKKLRVCPFCGKNKIEKNIDRLRGYYLLCGTCRARGPYGKIEDDAIDVWNKRAYQGKPKG